MPRTTREYGVILVFIKTPRTYFSPDQYILADSAYTSTEYLVPPYKAPHTRRRRIRRFNKRLSSVRIVIEHAFGILKGRWKSLTGLRLILNNDKQYESACMWITACVVLHNIFIDRDDIWTEEEGWWAEEDDEEYDNELLSLTPRQRREGHDKREAKNKVQAEMRAQKSKSRYL